MEQYIVKIADSLGLRNQQVGNTLELLEGGATVPFISRYRKEATGNLDELDIAAIRDRYQSLIEFEKRKAFILKSIEEQDKLSLDLQKKIDACTQISELEDLYLPYKPKRRTRATIAKEKGLAPLAKLIFEQSNINVEEVAAQYINAEKEVKSIEEAIAGAKDIVAEWINEDAEVRNSLRFLFAKAAVVTSKVVKSKKEEAAKYQDYFEFSELLHKIPSHRLLALRRGEKEGFLRINIAPAQEEAEDKVAAKVITKRSKVAAVLRECCEDAYKRLIKPSLELEFSADAKQKADEQAISVFADNLRELLLASPLGQKRILALDPGFRTGCKITVLNEEGKLLYDTAIYPHPPQNQERQAGEVIRHLVLKYAVEAIAIGNGTAGRESERFIKKLGLAQEVMVVMVNEAGASVYSASEVARKEFPDKDVTVRGSVSIGRRLADPLAELVKINPQSIGVGQYQHDVDQTALKKSLDEVVMSCVNAVGVNLNTASAELLSYVSGLGPVLAQNIVNYRNENGAFGSRAQLKKVPRLGEKAFEQSAGFLRIQGAKNPLDASAVHPERYAIVKEMAQDVNCDLKTLVLQAEKRKAVNLQKYVNDEVGLPTLKDILAELEKPGRDPRAEFEVFSFAEGVEEISDLREGMELNGIVTNVTKFGAFVDIGVHQDGLVHISQIADRFVKDPSDVVKVTQKVRVKVMEVEVARKRIGLSMKGLN